VSEEYTKVAGRFKLLSNPIRVGILRFLLEGDAGWNDLKMRLEKSGFGRINPNTLSFHLTRLIEEGFVEKKGSPESPTYSLKVERTKLKRLLKEAEEVTS